MILNKIISIGEVLMYNPYYITHEGASMEKSLKPTCLSEMTKGEEAILVDFCGGRSVNNRLASLGFTPGARINIYQNYGRGPLIIRVRGTHVALGRGEAAKILVRRTSHG